jgi:hypothetical protein
MRTLTRSRVRSVAPALVLTIAVACAACSGSSGSPTLSANPIVDAAKATLKAGSANITGQIVDAKGGHVALSGSWSGDLSATGQGVVKTTVTVPGEQPAPVEIRWAKAFAYFDRVPVSPATQASAGILALFTRPAADKPWSKVTTQTVVTFGLLRAFDPPTLLAGIETSESKKLGQEKINGQDTTHYRTTKPSALMGWWTAATVDVWLDHQNRLVRTTISSPSGGLTYDVSNYGTKVNVQPPAASEIAITSSANTVQLAGPYSVAASGTTNGVAWRLMRANATDGKVCWRWDATPPIKQVVQDRADGARCVTPAGPGSDPEDTVQFVIDADGTGSYDALGVVLPAGVKSATLGFVGGKTQPVATTSPLVWVGPASPTPGYLGVVLADGTKLDCGAGSIGSVTDLRDDTATAHAASAPWSCLAPS